MSKFIDKDQFDIGGVLFDTLVENTIVTEGFARKTLAQIDILMEKENREDEVLLEARKPTRTNSKLGPDYYNIKGVDISMDVFSRVWKDYERFSTPEAVATGIGVHPDHWLGSNLSDPKRTMVSDLTDLSYYAYHQGFIDEHVTWSNRARVYGERQRQEKFAEDDPRREAPSKDDIDFGNRGRDRSRAGRAIDKVNEQDLLPGELYSNMSRIPKTRWAGWLRFWDREKTNLPKDKSIIGREWKKTFLIGYQVEPTVVYEIWYNSIDSSFSVHDFRGTQMTRRYPTLQEAMKNLFGLLYQATQGDADVMNNIDNNIAISIGRTLTQDVANSDRMKDMLKREHDSEKERIKKEKEKEAKRKEAEAKRKEQAAKSWKQKAGENIDKVSAVVDKGKQFVKDVEETREKTRELGKKLFRNQEVEKDRDERAERMKAAEEARKKRQDEFTKKARDEMDRRKKEREEALRKAEEAERKASEDISNLMNDLDIKKMKISDAEDTFEKQKAEEERKRKNNQALAAIERMKQQVIDDEKAPKLRSDQRYKLPKPSDLTESEDFDENITADMVLDDMEQETTRLANDSSYKSQIDAIRRHAEVSPYTTTALKNTVIGELVEIYRQTRVKRNWMNSWWGRYILKGRKDPIVMPNDKPNVFKQAGNLIKGKRYIADFIIGVSIEDRANIEIWYITEPNPNYRWTFTDLFRAQTSEPKMISSFYVFDIESQTLLRKYLPHFRNAVQVAINKIAPVN